ncbi:MAG TPA: hypothetical protein VGB17_10285 [Pyrinomonadaceae bacterium]|jgi:hypothetical protein
MKVIKMKSSRNKIISHKLCGLLLSSALLLSAATLATAQSYHDPRLSQRATQITGDSFPYFTETPRGVHVFTRNRPRPEVLRAIDDGFAELFSIARRHGYRARLDHSAYTIFIARADRTRDSSGAYSPDIAIPALQYAGSVYDQGGYIYAAGMVLAYNPAAFIIAEHDRDFARISNVVRYEGEHLVLYYNDRQLYERTADHSRGGAHPILQ